MKYFLAESCQNTFVLFDCIQQSILNDEFLKMAHKALKKEDRDDAIILFNGKEEGGNFSVGMMVLGQDGQMGEFCGNGARAAAAFLFNRYSHFSKIYLRTHSGSNHLLTHEGESSYSVRLPLAKFVWNKKFITDLHAIDVHYPFQYVETIEPHLIIQGKLSDEELIDLGIRLNHQKHLFPLGINVNAWHVVDREILYVKTYERGVQRLTRSCGTGSVACASAYKKESVQIVTRGGLLKVIFRDQEIELSGEGKITEMRDCA